MRKSSPKSKYRVAGRARARVCMCSVISCDSARRIRARGIIHELIRDTQTSLNTHTHTASIPAHASAHARRRIQFTYKCERIPASQRLVRGCCCFCCYCANGCLFGGFCARSRVSTYCSSSRSSSRRCSTGPVRDSGAHTLRALVAHSFRIRNSPAVRIREHACLFQS